MYTCACIHPLHMFENVKSLLLHNARCARMSTEVSPDPGVRKADPFSDVDEERCRSRDRGS